MSFIHDFGKLLECPVCFEIFENPKGLWCGHTLCLKCFNQLITYNVVQCPLCRIQTRWVRNGPPSLYIVQDCIQLFNKEKESQKYLSSILPILQQKKLPASESSGEGHVTNAADLPSIRTDKSLACLDCAAIREIEDIWICSECNYRAMCSRCGLLNHAQHAVYLYLALVNRRKGSVGKWHECNGAKLDIVYKNRTDIEFNETRIKLLRLQMASKKVTASKENPYVDLLNFNEMRAVEQNRADDEVDQVTRHSKENFANLRDRLVAATTLAFLSGPEENFINELRSLPMTVDDLQREQEFVLQKQKHFQHELTEVLGLNPKPPSPPTIQGPKRIVSNYQGNGRRPYRSGGQYPRGNGSFRASANGNGFR